MTKLMVKRRHTACAVSSRLGMLVLTAMALAYLAVPACATTSIPGAARAPIRRALARDGLAREWLMFRKSATLTPSPSRPGEPGDVAAAVAIAGDTIVVGVPGVLYVFVKPKSGWAHARQVALLRGKRWPVSVYETYKSQVAISSDGRTIVDGAPGDPDNQWDSGVLVFARPKSGWVNATESADLSEHGPSALGNSVAVSADGSAIAAGDIGAEHLGDPGSVYVFARPAGGWRGSSTAKAKLTARPGTQFGLGETVAMSGDGRVVASAERNDEAGFSTVEVFVKPVSGWADATQTAQLSLTKRHQPDSFIEQLAVSASGRTIVAGVPGRPRGDYNPGIPGVAYVFDEPPRGWQDAAATAQLTSGRPRRFGDTLGDSVAISASGRVIAAFYQRDYFHGPAVDVFAERGARWRSAAPTQRFATKAGLYGDQLAISSDGHAIAVANPHVGEDLHTEAYVYSARR